MRSRLVHTTIAVATLALLAVVLVGLIGGGRGGDRAYELEQRLRCPVCKSVSIAESLSDTASAMRATVDEQIAAGRSDQQIIDYFRARYGDWVLLDPPLQGITLTLWLLPLGAAVVGLAALFARRRERPAGVAPDRVSLEQQRDQATRDILELDRQVDDNELTAAVADRLRGRYESVAARAVEALKSVRDAEPTQIVTAEQRPRRSRGRLVAYVLAATGAVVAALVLLPSYVGDRPSGGFVTGNEVRQAAPSPDPATVSDTELEAVVAANPDIIDMRLALADRYLAEGSYDQAARHYAVALDQQPDNPQAQAHYGWFLLQLDQPQEALRYVDQALSQEPAYLDALWFKANIALYGLSDPTTALAVLTPMQQRTDLAPTVREQVTALIQTAQRQQAGGR